MRRRFGHAIEEAVDEKALDVDASMQGTLSFNDPVNLRINGNFDGKLNAKGNLTIGKNACVKADIVGEIIMVAGKVKGTITALKELKIVSPAVVIGNVETPRLIVEGGACLEGSIKMHPASGTVQGGGMLSCDEVANYLEIEKTLVMEWAENGRLPGIKEIDGWHFDRATIDRWVSNEKIN